MSRRARPVKPPHVYNRQGNIALIIAGFIVLFLGAMTWAMEGVSVIQLPFLIPIFVLGGMAALFYQRAANAAGDLANN